MVLKSPSLAPPVFLPEVLGSLDIPLLSLLGPTAQEDDQGIAVLAEIDPVAGAEVYPVLEDASAHTLSVREIALFHPDQRCRHFGCGLGVKPIEPSGITGCGLRDRRTL